MSQTLCFNEYTFSPITRDNQPWIPARQLATALGYKDERSVHKIYERNKDEFSSMMSTVVKLTTGVMELPTRIFSLRGCHLLAMFARTPVAKAFRKWVLDVIEKYGDRVPVDAKTPSTGALSRISSRIIARELHKHHSTVLDVISRAAAVCPQRNAFLQDSYVDAKGKRCSQYLVSHEGITYLSQYYADKQTQAWKKLLNELDAIPAPVRPSLQQVLSSLPATERLFADIEKALFALNGTENWTHIAVRQELSGIGSVPFNVEKAIKHHINAAWYSLGLAQTSLQSVLALRKLA